MKQKLRSEINTKDTWDLTYIYKNEDEFNKELDSVKKEIQKINEYKGHLLDSSESLLKYLEFSDVIERKLYKLYYYAHLNLDVDTTNTHYQQMEGIVSNLLQEEGIISSFVMPELMKGDYNKVLEFINENKGLEKYRFNLECIYRYQKHTLNEEEEKLLSNLSKALGNSSDVFENLTDADITFPNILVNGEKVELTESNYSILIRSENRNVRKNALNKLLGTYHNYKNTLAKTFSGNVYLLTSMAKINKYNSSIEASLFGDKIDVSVYNKLIETINNNFEPLYDYFRLKKEALKLNKLHLYDMYVPMITYDKDYSFMEAKEIVLEALSVLGPDYINNLNKAFDERWIDIYNNKGKRTGAYSSGFYDTKPYLLLNFEGKYNDVTTLAHELGHSMHTYYSCSNQPYNLSSYNIFVAEVASTVNELLLVRYLINKTNDKQEKMFLLNELLELYRATIYRQVMFAEFERDMHADSEKGEILTHEYLSEHYYELVKKYFGKDVICDEVIKNEWMRIPHFYYNFYVYKYAIGLSCATKIVDDILDGKEGALDNYLAFLKTGGSMYPEDELKVAGVNIYDSEVYMHAINSFQNYVKEYRKLLKK